MKKLLFVLFFIYGCNGKDGDSCTVSDVNGVSTIVCGDTSTTIYDGRDGKDGLSNKINESIHCFGQLANTINIAASYNIDQFATGDLFISACIIWPTISLCNSIMYSVNQVGYDNAPITIVADTHGADDFGSYTISLNRSTKIITVSYKDVSLNSTLTWTKPSSECVVNKY